MEMKNKIIIGIIVILVIVGALLVSNYLSKEFIPKEAPVEKGEDSRYVWEVIEPGVWTRTDLECDSILDYACVSNCYVTIPVCPFDPNVVESAVTPEGTEVACFKQGCTFQDCDIICPV